MTCALAARFAESRRQDPVPPVASFYRRVAATSAAWQSVSALGARFAAKPAAKRDAKYPVWPADPGKSHAAKPAAIYRG